MLHEVSFFENIDGNAEFMACCSCGWSTRGGTLTEVQLKASVHDLTPEIADDDDPVESTDESA